MTPVSHFFISWVVANTAEINKRERMLVTAAGVVPDIDGLVIIGDLLKKENGQFLPWYEEFHHVLAHNIVISIMALALTFFLAWKRCFSPLELISREIDTKFIAALHNRFAGRT